MVDRKLGLCYGSIELFNTMLHNLFLLYHVETFVAVYKIDKMSFWIGEAVFLLWNSLNDPLFGWLSDHKYLHSKDAENDVVLRRLNSLRIFGPLFGLSFLSFWVAWLVPSMQFVICLCLYDSFLTMIDLHHSALLADLAVSGEVRTRLNSYCSIFGAAGALSVFMSYAVWNRSDMFEFQIFCGVMAIISMSGFVISTNVLRRTYVQKSQEQQSQRFYSVYRSSFSTPETTGACENNNKEALKGFVKELCGHKNFMWFSVMNITQVFHCHFNSNFFPLFLDNLLGQSMSPGYGSIILGISFVAPHLNNLYFLSLCRKYGVYHVVRGLFWIKLLLSSLMFILGPNHIVLLTFFIASNRVFTEGTCKLLTLVISDLVDEDYVINKRQQAVSALMFGTAALLSKPGQTLAPLLGTWLLAVQTGHDVFESGNRMGSMKVATDSLGHMDLSHDTYRHGVFLLLVYIPMACGIIQLLAWSRFNLHGKRLSWVKSIREGACYAAQV